MEEQRSDIQFLIFLSFLLRFSAVRNQERVTCTTDGGGVAIYFQNSVFIKEQIYTVHNQQMTVTLIFLLAYGAPFLSL